jgi:lipopolysaccharide export system permease protein
MFLLTRYLLAQFSRHFLTLTVGFAALYLLIDFFEKFDHFADAGKPMSLVAQFFLLNIPYIIDQLSPILILLSGVVTLGLLNHNNELLALKATGIPLRRIIRPILIGSLILTGLFITAAQTILPKTIATTNDIWYEQIRGKVPLGIFRNGRYYYKGTEGFYSFQWPNKEKLVFKDFSYSTWDENYNVRTMVVAAFADWEDPQWKLIRGQITKQDHGDFHVEHFKTLIQTLPESPEDFLVPEYESAEMSLTELFFEIGKQETRTERLEARVDFYGRLSYLLLGLPLLLLGLPILILSYQKWGKDLSIAIPISCFMAFAAWGSWGALQTFAKAGYMPPLAAAVIVHLLFSAIGIYLLKELDS